MKKPLWRFFAIKETRFDLESIKVRLCVFYATGLGGALAAMSPTTQEATQELPKKLPKKWFVTAMIIGSDAADLTRGSDFNCQVFLDGCLFLDWTTSAYRRLTRSPQPLESPTTRPLSVDALRC
ncbi:hypothetical protein [Pseudomonas sp. GM102]|uniref:hypothetical protein n=1 Tax=Pseudomonas sp. GM102 TaxID=1144321 RepID=UPI0005191580|nr:hypothetical protein [Pseudomonas sp. GM102]